MALREHLQRFRAVAYPQPFAEGTKSAVWRLAVASQLSTRPGGTLTVQYMYAYAKDTASGHRQRHGPRSALHLGPLCPVRISVIISLPTQRGGDTSDTLYCVVLLSRCIVVSPGCR
eukprot:5816925-Prymnesium_polylepis.1